MQICAAPKMIQRFVKNYIRHFFFGCTVLVTFMCCLPYEVYLMTARFIQLCVSSLFSFIFNERLCNLHYITSSFIFTVIAEHTRYTVCGHHMTLICLHLIMIQNPQMK